MSYYSVNKSGEREDKIKSAIITAVIWSIILAFVFLYTIKVSFPKEEEPVTTMLVNFGDNRNGNGLEEPAPQEGSVAAITNDSAPEVVTTPQPAPVTEAVKTPEKEVKSEKVLTGKSEKSTVKTTEKTEKKSTPKVTEPKKAGVKGPETSSGTKSTTANAKTGSGDGQGNAAIGNLLKGKGTKTGTQGTGGTIGNAGDPLGGEGNGDSKIGVDRKLTGFIPGTMGRGGAKPSASCTEDGSIVISYTVDKAGNVVSAQRSSGSKNQCIVDTAVSWVKRYVKAEKANVSSTGTYSITF